MQIKLSHKYMSLIFESTVERMGSFDYARDKVRLVVSPRESLQIVARFTRYTVRTNCLFHLHRRGLNSTFLAQETRARNARSIALSTKPTRAQSIRKVFSRKYFRLHTSLSERISTRCCITNNLRQLPFVILKNVKVFSLR